MKLFSISVLFLALAFLASGCGKSDSDIQKAVQDKLAADNVTGVTATVNDGVATLAGEVADITVKTRAENSAKSVQGVKAVNNNIALRPPPTPLPAPADPALKGKVEENLKRAGCTGAAVEVVNGRVIIKGTVPDAKYVECIQVVNQSGGAGFDNQLQRAK